MGMEARLHQVTVTLSAQQLADLFAKYDHPELGKVLDGTVNGSSYDALVKDAEAFAKELGVTPTEYPDFAQDLAASFQRRSL